MPGLCRGVFNAGAGKHGGGSEADQAAGGSVLRASLCKAGRLFLKLPPSFPPLLSTKKGSFRLSPLVLNSLKIKTDYQEGLKVMRL